MGRFRLEIGSRSAGAGDGGDFCACALRGPGRLAVVIGDACGRGTDGARLLPAVLPRVRKLLDSAEPPGRLLRTLNEALVEGLPDDRFVTAAAFELDAETGKLAVASAGHVPLLVRSRHGNVLMVGMPSGPPLGLFGGLSFREDIGDFSLGDLVVLMTDGVLEAVESDLFAMPRLRRLLAAAPEAAVAHRFLTEQLDACVVNHRLDDMLLASLELLPEPGRKHSERSA